MRHLFPNCSAPEHKIQRRFTLVTRRFIRFTSPHETSGIWGQPSKLDKLPQGSVSICPPVLQLEPIRAKRGDPLVAGDVGINRCHRLSRVPLGTRSRLVRR
jgi:hypothetical protein